ncbi:hypothetical protein PTI98_007154 [Pleurotus ostreatus]|nr:hypothetical protein PTI98_007154 [Pleurotus ostreatus]
MLFAHDGLWSIICDAGTRTKVCLGHDVLVTQITFKGTPSGSRSTVELEYQAFDGEAKSCQIASLIPGQVENVSLQLPLKSQAEHCIVNSGTSNISLVGFYMSSGEPTLPMPHPPYWPWAAMHSPAINPPHVPATISVTPLAVPALGTGPASRTRRSVARTSSELTIPDEEVKPTARKRKSSLADVKPPLKPAVKRPRAIRKGLAADDTVSIDPSTADPDVPASGKAVVPTTVPGNPSFKAHKSSKKTIPGRSGHHARPEGTLENSLLSPDMTPITSALSEHHARPEGTLLDDSLVSAARLEQRWMFANLPDFCAPGTRGS